MKFSEYQHKQYNLSTHFKKKKSLVEIMALFKILTLRKLIALQM